ncbi:hypothetical protein BB560_005814 [Smittium megazygosporum]|uniref:N-acetyltransferase domain-containing protein n=1 Tax=Smittium megazygosporum TaxID=133381 RepID=A0A2T9YVF9_9FUNG|nr:hypothetical protein BB560_005814 [Smittium megazygosporum]
MTSVVHQQLRKDELKSINMQSVSEDNLNLLEDINSKLFPIKYSPKFYKQVLLGEIFGRLCLFNEECIGSILGRFQPLNFTNDYKGNFNTAGAKEMNEFAEENFPENRNPQELYVMTCGVHNKYRRLGIAKKLLDCIIKDAKEARDIKQVTLHVQTKNMAALNFYFNYGFRSAKKITNYYRNFDDCDAYIMTYKL